VSGKFHRKRLLLVDTYIFGWTSSVVLVTLYADSLNAIIPAISSNTYKLLGLVMYVLAILVPALAQMLNALPV
jgi:hypothetical protein